MNSLLFRRSRFCYNFRAIKKGSAIKNGSALIYYPIPRTAQNGLHVLKTILPAVET